MILLFMHLLFSNTDGDEEKIGALVMLLLKVPADIDTVKKSKMSPIFVYINPSVVYELLLALN